VVSLLAGGLLAESAWAEAGSQHRRVESPFLAPSHPIRIFRRNAWAGSYAPPTYLTKVGSVLVPTQGAACCQPGDGVRACIR
jgi:hypothetical protein